MKKLFLLLIRFYQLAVSPYFPARCRFTPTCSQYALEAVERYGAAKGGYLVLRCHPFYKGNFYDPVP